MFIFRKKTTKKLPHTFTGEEKLQADLSSGALFKIIFSSSPGKHFLISFVLLRFLAMDEAVLRSTGQDLESGSGRKNTSLDLSLATLHQAENKVEIEQVLQCGSICNNNKESKVGN